VSVKYLAYLLVCGGGGRENLTTAPGNDGNDGDEGDDDGTADDDYGGGNDDDCGDNDHCDDTVCGGGVEEI
jgi:hypothetical protein